MTRLRSVLLLAPALLLPGCDDLFGPDVSGRLLDLDGQVDFLVREIHGFGFTDVGEPEMALYMATDELYPCRGFRLEAEITLSADLVTVDIAGVREPHLCFRETLPADFRRAIAIDEGEWTFRFVYRDRVQEFSVTIDTAAIQIAGADGALATPVYDLFWRYPPRSFAVGCDHAGGFAEPCTELVDSVEATPGVEPFVFGPEGGIPYPVSYDDAIYNWRVSYFISADDAAWAAARSRAADVHALYTGMRYYLLDWRNEISGSGP